MTESKQKWIEHALPLFAERGFYGVSIAAVAADLNLTKQALLHHFGTKEKLYGAVLDYIAKAMMMQINEPPLMPNPSPRDRLIYVFLGFLRLSQQRPDWVKLLMRELMDNSDRAASARIWYLSPFLDDLTSMITECGLSDQARARAAVYQILGAINYLVVSQATLTKLYGVEGLSRMHDAYPQCLVDMIKALLPDE